VVFCFRTPLGTCMNHLRRKFHFSAPDEKEVEFGIEYMEFSDAGCGRDSYKKDSGREGWKQQLHRRTSWYESSLETISEMPEPDGIEQW